VVLLSLAFGAPAAHAGGPGVTLFSPNRTQPATLSGAQISRFADVGPRRYTVRASPGAKGTRLTLRSMSIRGLLSLGGLNPDRIKFLTIGRADGSLLSLTRADIADPPPFPEGPALVTDDGGTTRFLRPVRDLDGTNAEDNIKTSNAGPLEIVVDGGGLLAVKAKVSRTKVRTGDTVTFSARVRFPPPGAQLTYRWDFGDGTSAVGQYVTHAYTLDGDMQAQVSVRGSGGSTARCSTTCGGVAAVDLRVGEPPKTPKASDSSPGSGTGNPLAPGSSSGDGAAGQGGSGAGAGTGSAADATSKRKREPKKPAPAAAKKPDPAEPSPDAGPRITGVLLEGQATLPTAKLPTPKLASTQAGGGPKGLQATRGGDDEPAQLSGGVALALLVMGLGALRERRHVKLRVA